MMSVIIIIKLFLCLNNRSGFSQEYRKPYNEYSMHLKGVKVRE